MNFTKIFAAFALIITVLFNLFPNSDTIAEIYYGLQSSEFAWIETSDKIEEAVEEKDAETLASMASEKLKGKHPNVEQDIRKLFDSIKGDILYVEDMTEFGGGTDCEYRFSVTTTTDDYQIFIFFTAVGPDESVLGLRRMMMWVKTDKYFSWWTDTENYIAEGVIEDAETNLTRRWCCGQGNSADEYVFMVKENCSKDSNNIEIWATRNDSGRDVPEMGYALGEDDVLKIHLIPEGEEPPVPGTRKPDLVLSGQERRQSYRVDPGKYYLYVEPSDMQMYYSVSVETRL